MSKINKQDGPVAVTGASGYIGSRIVEDLLGQGYDVHACVRDASNVKKVEPFDNNILSPFDKLIFFKKSRLLKGFSFVPRFELFPVTELKK